jgi:hypothetical protein
LGTTLRAHGRLSAAGAILERCVREDWRPGFCAQLCAPGQLPTESRIRSLRSILSLWQRFGVLLWQAFEHGGA